MIASIDKQTLSYLYKYDNAKIGIDNIIDIPIDKLLGISSEKMAEKLDGILPVFEQDHEILLVELDKYQLQLGVGILIKFDSVRRVFPLTKLGKDLLAGKINDKIKIEDPLFQEAVNILKNMRILRNKRYAAVSILNVFKFSLDRNKFNYLDEVFKSILNEKELNENKPSYVFHLLTYNKTPNYIPSGPLEALAKIGLIAYLYFGKSDEDYKLSSYYSIIANKRGVIKGDDVISSFDQFISALSSDELKVIDKLKESIAGGPLRSDFFKCSYYFLSLRILLNRNDKNLLLYVDTIKRLIAEEPYVAEIVLMMIGYVFSFEQLYESIHVLRKNWDIMLPRKTQIITHPNEEFINKKEKSSSKPEEKDHSPKEKPNELDLFVKKSNSEDKSQSDVMVKSDIPADSENDSEVVQIGNDSTIGNQESRPETKLNDVVASEDSVITVDSGIQEGSNATVINGTYESEKITYVETENKELNFGGDNEGGQARSIKDLSKYLEIIDDIVKEKAKRKRWQELIERILKDRMELTWADLEQMIINENSSKDLGFDKYKDELKFKFTS